jgi:hypothetical protein
MVILDREGKGKGTRSEGCDGASWRAFVEDAGDAAFLHRFGCHDEWC